jgi:hypothetical protein
LCIRNINCEFIKDDPHATCLVYYDFFLDRQFRGDVAILVFLKTMASYNPTSLTPSLFTEVPVLSQESEWSCICVLGISHFPISTIFLLNFWNFSDDVILIFHFIIDCEKRIMMMNLQQGLHEKFCKVGSENRLKLLSRLWI